MSNPFFDHPILNSPYECPTQHWELDDSGQPTQQIIQTRRDASFITPIPKPKKRKGQNKQGSLHFDAESQTAAAISSGKQEYYLSTLIGELRSEVAAWRALPDARAWKVTPETARLLEHWLHHNFSGIRPFFCRLEAVETAIWLTEVAPKAGNVGKKFIEHLESTKFSPRPTSC